MKREQLEHLLRAAASITKTKDLVVIGSQAILASFENPPATLLISVEADLYPLYHPERADLIDGAIGEGSMFNETFGYYAHGVGPETAKSPSGWQERLVPLRTEATQGATGWCLEVHDLVLAKAARGDVKDRRYLKIAIEAGLVEVDVLLERLTQMPLDEASRENIQGQITQVVRLLEIEGQLGKTI